MIKKIKNKLFVASAIVTTNLMLATGAIAADSDTGGVQPVDPSGFGEKITEMVKSYGMPLGGSLLFLSVLIICIRLILSASNAQKRTQVMEGFLYVGIGGAGIGGCLFIAGLILGVGQNLGQ